MKSSVYPIAAMQDEQNLICYANYYLIGSLRNPRVPEIAQKLRAAGIPIFDYWYAAGWQADDYWQEYEVGRGRSFAQALDGYAANHVYEFDKSHLDRSQGGIM